MRRWDNRTATWEEFEAPRRPAPVLQSAAESTREDSALQAPRETWQEQHFRAYHNGRFSRLTSDWYAANTSADAELVASLRDLRSRSRALVRDNAHAKQAKRLIVNNVIGQGIGLQAQVKDPRGQLLKSVNAELEDVWQEWSEARSCHVAGVLHYCDLERLAFGEIFEAGEVFIRFYNVPTPSGVSLSLELIEPERLAEEYENIAAPGSAIVRMGVELDRFNRPLAYYVKNYYPGDIRRHLAPEDHVERVPAGLITHAYPLGRWPQTRGEPWMHAVAKRLWDVEGYTEAEIVAMRAAASYMGIVQRPEAESIDMDPARVPERQVTPGMMMTLEPGETFTEWAPRRPNNSVDPFLRFMLREISAGIGVGYASLTGDYSQATYSSERARLLEDRDHWRVLQFWFLRSFRQRVHREFVQAAVLSNRLRKVRSESYQLDARRFEAARFKLRGWGWVDPTKEVAAYKEAVKAGFISIADVIAQTAQGMDFEDMLEAIATERTQIADLGLQFDVLQPEQPPVAPAPAQEEAPDDAAKTPGDDDEARQLKLVQGVR